MLGAIGTAAAVVVTVGAVADAVHVLETGTIIASGPFAQLSSDRSIVQTYLGSL